MTIIDQALDSDVSKTLQANHAVEMLEGFEVPQNSCYLAQIEGCVNVLTADIGHSNICGTSGGRAQISMNGGTPPYTYSWSNGSNSNCIDDLPNGTYSVTISDADGLTSIESCLLYTSPSPRD